MKLVAISAIPPIPTIPNFGTGLAAPISPATTSAQGATAIGVGQTLTGTVSSTGGITPSGSISTSANFGNSLASAIDSLSATQNAANAQALGVSTGQANLGDAMVASQKASLDTQLAVAVKTAAVGAFNQIMAMQV